MYKNRRCRYCNIRTFNVRFGYDLNDDEIKKTIIYNVSIRAENQTMLFFLYKYLLLINKQVFYIIVKVLIHFIL